MHGNMDACISVFILPTVLPIAFWLACSAGLLSVCWLCLLALLDALAALACMLACFLAGLLARSRACLLVCCARLMC